MSRDDPTGDEMMAQDEAQYLRERERFIAAVDSLRDAFPDLFASYFRPFEGGSVESLRNFFVQRGNGSPRLPVGRAISTIKGLDEDYAELRAQFEEALRLLRVCSGQAGVELRKKINDFIARHGDSTPKPTVAGTEPQEL